MDIVRVGSILVNTFVWSGELALIAIGMGLTYAILGFANFAHAELVTVGAYLTYTFHVLLGLPLLLSIPISMVLCGILGVLLDIGVFARVRGASSVVKMVISVGIAMIIRSSLAILFGSSAVHLGYATRPIPNALGIRITDLQLTIIISALLAMALFHFGLKYTKFGKSLRATASNAELAQVKGINTSSVIRWTWLIAGSFAALGGTLLGLETQLRPVLGTLILMPMFAAITVGGLGSMKGVVVGALLIASVQNLALSINFGALFAIGPIWLKAGYKTAVALIALVITLLIRPQGIFGRRDDL